MTGMGLLSSKTAQLALCLRDAPAAHALLEHARVHLQAMWVDQIPREPMVGGQLGRSYWNVAEKVRRDGGSVLFGWQLIDVVDVLLVCTPHALWCDKSGELWDVSPHPLTGLGKGTTAFLCNAMQGYDLTKPPILHDTIISLIGDPRVEAFKGPVRANCPMPVWAAIRRRCATTSPGPPARSATSTPRPR